MEIPPYIAARMSLVKSSPTKLRVFKKSQPHDQMMLYKYVKLTDKDFLYVAQFNSTEWMTYNAMKEYEYLCNRKGADENATGKTLLTPDLFQEVVDAGNPTRFLTFGLYTIMRAAEMSYYDDEKRYNKSLEIAEEELCDNCQKNCHGKGIITEEKPYLLLCAKCYPKKDEILACANPPPLTKK